MDVLEGSGSGFESGSGSGWNHSDWEEDQSLFTDTELVVLTTLCVPLLLLGLLGNALTILVVWRRPQMRSTTYLYLSSMAVSDILILLLMPLDLYKLWRFRPWLLGDAVCKLSMFVGECCTFSSILHMTALGAERYLAVCFPLRARLLVTRGRVRVLIAGLWGVAMLSAGPVFALVGVEQFEGGASECRCTQYAQTSGLLKAMLWLSNLYFICPLTILSLLYGLIARRLHLRAHTHRDKTHRQTLRMMVLFYVSAAVNPLLYNIMSARYRANVLAMLRLTVGSTDELRHRARTSPLTASHSSTHF
ncbi:Growth hormone secretagogue receptor type 1 [Labeo rohita]|uniref:Growth hormone secretagogue receptor type 1 n=1 Tax=Labeo rohita TaxID=84645 RepID=A0ABQ8KZD7_LABRO|nr:Growth hormone secretagogue receptor type 1 [Labeo rohita]